MPRFLYKSYLPRMQRTQKTLAEFVPASGPRRMRPFITIICALSLLLSACGEDQDQSGQVKPTATSAASADATMQYKDFKGIYEFSGQNSHKHVDNPALAGRCLIYYWKQLEPRKGQYNWKLIDRDMKLWIDRHKKVILRVSTSGWTSWDRVADSQHGTPQWVYDQGVASVTEIDGSVHPQYWAPAFLQNLRDFVRAFAKRYDGNIYIGAVEIGVGDGGETKVDTHKHPNVLSLWKRVGYSDQIWWETIQRIIGFYTAEFHHTPLVLMPDSSFIGKTRGYGMNRVVSYAVQHKLWLQDNGLTANRTLSPDWHKVPIIAEQRNPTTRSGDTLLEDLQAALNLGATYILIFASDIDNDANQPVLQQVAALAHQ
jgi:hypothetical protein